MGFGKAVKSLFWQSEGDGASEASEALVEGEEDELTAEDLAAFISEGSPHTVPADEFDPVEVGTIEISTTDVGAVAIDFQAQYDTAGIPDTDEVEQLENFLERLDPQLPQASKIAAAQAFLGAIGKDKQAVLDDAERKIKRVHGVLQSKQQQTAQTLASEQAAIDELQAKIDAHRERIEGVKGELEGVKKACLVEESRLQAARVFFGEVNPPTDG
jgi:hypothetical protein